MDDETTPDEQVVADGVIHTAFLVVSDQDRSRDWWRDVFGAEVIGSATRSSCRCGGR